MNIRIFIKTVAIISLVIAFGLGKYYRYHDSQNQVREAFPELNIDQFKTEPDRFYVLDSAGVNTGSYLVSSTSRGWGGPLETALLVNAEGIVQDIRVLIIVVSGIYIVFFFNSLKVKFLPQVAEKSSKRVQELLQQELKTHISDGNTKTEDILKAQELVSNSQLMDKILNAPVCVSYKNYVFLNRRFGKSD